MSEELNKYTGRQQTLTANSDSISAIVQQAALEAKAANRARRVPLDDVETIRDIAEAYLADCADSSHLPSVSGIAARMGYTRQALYRAAAAHPGSAFDDWLQSFSDVCGETMMAAAMAGSVKEVSAIFVAKSRYGWRDNLQIEVVQPVTPLGREIDAEEIAAKYRDLPSD